MLASRPVVARADRSAEDVLLWIDKLVLPYGEGNESVLGYHRVFAHRYSQTLNSIADLPRDLRVLELAAAPYGMSCMLRAEYFDHVELAGFGKQGTVKKISLGFGDARYDFDEKHFNVECDSWPYEDERFDLVISCEMVEHLALDPMNVFAEANRVLRPGGYLLVSTPNAVSLQNLIKTFAFMAPSLAPHYRLPRNLESIYQRHNRELTPGALHELFRASGFDAEPATLNCYPLSPMGLPDKQVQEITRMAGSLRLRGDTLNFLGKKLGPVVERYPTAEELYLQSDVVMQNSSPPPAASTGLWGAIKSAVRRAAGRG